MGLVNELQASAESDDVLTVLRKAKRVSVKLARREISTWLNYEQNGYPEEVEPPAYRRVAVTAGFNTNGYMPAGFGYAMNGIFPIPGLFRAVTTAIGEPISTIKAWIGQLDRGGFLIAPLSAEDDALARQHLQSNNPHMLGRVTLLSLLEDSHVRAIPEHVKNRVLDWACELEEAGVLGEDQSFTPAEKEAAESITFNISGCNIEQLNNSGDNLKET